MDALRPAAGAPAPDQRDGDVIAQLRAGDTEGAFDRLARRYETRVYRLCVALLRDPAAAQDAAQESLLRVWKALGRYDGRAALSTWIYTITRNRCLTALAQRRHDLSLGDEAVQQEVEAVAAPAPDADGAATLRRLVEDLPEAPRRVLQLYYFEDRALADVADMLGQPEGTIKTQLFRARLRLQRRLQELGLAERARWLS